MAQRRRTYIWTGTDRRDLWDDRACEGTGRGRSGASGLSAGIYTEHAAGIGRFKIKNGGKW